MMRAKKFLETVVDVKGYKEKPSVKKYKDEEIAKAQADVNEAVSILLEALKEHKKVEVPGFGTFEIKTRAERNGRNPKTKETIVIPAKTVITFKNENGLV